MRSRDSQSRRGPDRRANHTYAGIAAERELTRAMLSDPLRVEPIAEKVGPDRFRDPNYRAIFAAMLDTAGDYTLEELTDKLDPSHVEIVNELMSEPDLQVYPEATVDASISVIEMRDLNDRLAEIDTLVSLAPDTQKDELIAEKRRLLKEIELSGQPMAKGFKFLKNRRPRTRE
jgi:replicative DNA helicase